MSLHIKSFVPTYPLCVHFIQYGKGTAVRQKYFRKQEKYICIFYHFSTLNHHRLLTFALKGKKPIFHTCHGYPEYFWEPHWKSMGLPEISSSAVPIVSIMVAGNMMTQVGRVSAAMVVTWFSRNIPEFSTRKLNAWVHKSNLLSVVMRLNPNAIS